MPVEKRSTTKRPLQNAPVKRLIGGSAGALRLKQLYRRYVVNIQKIQNRNSEFSVNSLRDLSIDKASYLGNGLRNQRFLDPSVVYPQKFVGGSDHIYLERLSLRTFFK